MFTNAKNGFLSKGNNILLYWGSKLVFFVIKSIANVKDIQKQTYRPWSAKSFLKTLDLGSKGFILLSERISGKFLSQVPPKYRIKVF